MQNYLYKTVDYLLQKKNAISNLVCPTKSNLLYSFTQVAQGSTYK